MHNLLIHVSNSLLDEGYTSAEIAGRPDFPCGFLSGSTLLIFSETLNPTVEMASAWVNEWYELLPEGVALLVIVAVFDEERRETMQPVGAEQVQTLEIAKSGVMGPGALPLVPADFSAYLAKARKTSFLNRSCTIVALDATARKLAGRVDVMESMGLINAFKAAVASYDAQTVYDADQLAQRRLHVGEEADAAVKELLKVRPLVTYSLIAACLLIFGVMSLAGGSENQWTLLRFGSNFAPLDKAGQIWRWGSAMFIHIGFLHLAVNLYSLYAVGPMLERVLGNRAFAALYAVSGLAGGLASTYFGKGGLSAGASGAIFGLFGAGLWIGKYWKSELPPALRKSLFSGFGPTILYNLMIGFSSSFIDNSAHLGGLIAGVVVMAGISRVGAIKLREETGILKWVTSLLASLPVLCLCWAMMQSGFYPTMASYPARQVEPSGSPYRVSLPLFMQYKLSDGTSSFVGPGFVWLHTSVELGPEEATPDVSQEAGAAEVLKQMEAAGLKPESHELLIIKRRPWLVWKVQYPEEKLGFVAFSVDGRKVWMPMMITIKAQEETVKEFFIKSLETVESSSAAGKK